MPFPVINAAGNLAAPLNLADIGDYIATVFRQQRHPVYNAAGQVVGSYDTLDALCQGQWFVDQGMAQPPPSQLYVVDFWGTRVPLATQCTRSAVANAAGTGSLVFPQAVQPASALEAQSTVNEDVTGDPSAISLTDLVGPSQDAATLQTYETYAIWGVVGLLGLSILMSGRDSGSRKR